MYWPELDTTPAFAGACIISVTKDAVIGELTIQADFGGRQQTELVYEGMFCSQLDESSKGIFVNGVEIITQEELGQDGYMQAAKKLRGDNGIEEPFLRTMLRRGNNLYVHHTNRGEFIVLAKRLAYGETVAIDPADGTNSVQW